MSHAVQKTTLDAKIITISLESYYLDIFLPKYPNDQAYELQVISFFFTRFCLYRFCNLPTACNKACTLTRLIIGAGVPLDSLVPSAEPMTIIYISVACHLL